MGKIVCLMGKSSTGKDTLLQLLFDKNRLQLQKIVPYTTRPIRVNEENGVDYFFVDEDGYQKLKKQGSIIEERAYNTVHGIWRYFTVADENLDLENTDYFLVGTLEVYNSLCAFFGKDRIIPVLIDLEDGVRLTRALEREKKQENPKYQELCRRFLADCEDFSEEKIQTAGIEKRFYNNDLQECLDEIIKYLLACGVQEKN